ncbi:MAG: PQQ-binding-like beta-propeller repeat protein [Pirellulales bacterium]|nr:PQQ-binding-like beta-propeller repeat protein [Pirellulales bacterium]
MLKQLLLVKATLLVTVFVYGNEIVLAENWPQWRGARFSGVSRETRPPVEWSNSKNVAWRLPLPGQAGATPVVWEDRIYLTTAAENELQLWCVSTAGEKLWQQTLAVGDRSIRGDEGNMASPSPCTDGEHVWAMVGTGALTCFDKTGGEIWKFNLQDRYGEFQIQFGMTSTPVLFGGRLFLQLIHGDCDASTREAVVVCLDAQTGEEVWKQPRPSDAQEECEHSYASPIIYALHGPKRAFLLTHGADYLVAHALSDGRELWRRGGLNQPGNYHPTLRFVASPAVGENLIVVPSAKNGPVLGLRPYGGGGEVADSQDAIVWRYPNKTPDVPSPLVQNGLVYLCRENGNLLCLDAETGEQLYHERTVRDRHRASPVWADGKVYLTSRSGVVTVVKAGREFEVLASNDVGEEIASSPVFANGTLYLRTYTSLFAIREP